MAQIRSKARKWDIISRRTRGQEKRSLWMMKAIHKGAEERATIVLEEEGSNGETGIPRAA